MIIADQLAKSFTVQKKAPGLKASLKALFRREYLKKEALRPVSFTVKPGEILGLVGANGAGKTTLIKLLAGVIHPSSGSATVLGFTPWERRNGFRRQISLIMGQKAQLWWDLPAADCFLLLREIYQVEHKQFRDSLDFLATTLGVTGQLEIPIRRLSLGERMKMELIAALLHQPRVIFLDEPTIGLDITSQKAIRNFLLEYSRKHSPAIILTSHYMEDIQALCERLMIIREGSFVFDGPTATIASAASSEKEVTVHLADQETLLPSPERLSFSPQEILQWEGQTLRVRVTKDRVPQVVNSLLHQFAVQDLSIQEEDISNLIERLMQRGVVGSRHS